MVRHYTSKEDPAVVKAMMAGDIVAFEQLVKQVYPKVLTHITSRFFAQDPETAKDVLQDACINALKGIKDFRGESTFSTWFTSIARFRALAVRKENLTLPTVSNDERDLSAQDKDGDGLSFIEQRLADFGYISTSDPVASAEGRDLLAKFLQAVERLPDKCAVRDGFILSVDSLLTGVLCKDLAEARGIAAGTAKSQMWRFRQFCQTWSRYNENDRDLRKSCTPLN